MHEKSRDLSDSRKIMPLFHPSVDILRIRVVHSWNDSSQGKKGLPTSGYTCLVLPWGVRRGAPWLPVASVFPLLLPFPSKHPVGSTAIFFCVSEHWISTHFNRRLEHPGDGEWSTGRDRNDRGNDSLQPNRLCQVIMQKLSGWKILAFLLMF